MTQLTSQINFFESLHSDLSDMLKARFDARQVCLAGRGASAIYAVCRVIGYPGSKIAIPSHICPSVPQAVIRAGKRPWFLDIDPDDFNIDPRGLSNIPKDTAAIIAPHIYGHPLKIKEILEFCRNRGVVLIEDIAQAAGATIDGREVGTFGDFAVMSFHPSKLIPGRGGGALIASRRMGEYSSRIKSEFDQLPESEPDYTVRSSQLTADVNRLLNLTRDGDAREKEIARLYMQNLDLIVQRKRNDTEIPNIVAMSALKENLKTRSERSNLYKELIKSKRIKHPSLACGSPLFRYSIVIDGNDGPALRKKITENLRAFGIHASNLYYPAHLIFPDDTNAKLPHSEYVADRIINLWLDDSASEQYIQKTAEIIENSI
jgi:dTDP-4-amino-4,6-dideoxygalactose transaminase